MSLASTATSRPRPWWQIPWWALVPLVAGYLLAFVVRYGTAVILPGLRADFGVDEAAIGALSAAYFWPYALIQPIAGVLSDWWGPRRSVALFLFGAAIGTLLFAVAPLYPIAIVGRMLGGAGVGIVYVCGINAIGQWFRSEHFGTASGIYAATGTLGGLLAARPLAALVEVTGWRTSFAIIAALLFVTAVLAFVAIPELPRTAAGPRGLAALAGVWAGAKQAIGLRNVWLTGAYTFVALGVLSSMQGLWTVPFLTDLYGLDRIEAATVLEAWSYGLLVAIPIWGFLADRVIRSRKATILIATGTQLIVWVALILVPTGWPREALFPLFFYAAFTNGCWMPAYALVRSTAPAAIAGTALGLLNFAFFFGAAAFQSGTGFLLARFSQVGGRLPVEAYQVLFGLFIASFLASAMAVVFTREKPPDDQ